MSKDANFPPPGMDLNSLLARIRRGELKPEEALRQMPGRQAGMAAIQELEPSKLPAIAIIGMSGRFPGAPNLQQYWSNLQRGTISIRTIPPQRWLAEDYYHPDPQQPGKSNSQWGGFLEDIDQFDPLFFALSPREAELMDPQQRLFLMEAWRALEQAGYAKYELDKQACGVFVGCGPSDYLPNLYQHGVDPDALAFTGNSNPILAARIAFLLNLRGPSVVIDTACSSSLVAVILACESIAAGTSSLALAGGVSVFTTPQTYQLAGKAGMLSPTGRCHTFDARADGFAPAEGVGVVLLKRLDWALRDGDSIQGIIRAAGLNQDGRSNGITAPSATAQTALMRDIYQRYAIDPEQIGLVEAHGTGTQLGDPIETAALVDAYGRKPSRDCVLGAVKANIGHASSAAGIAGLLKVLLCLQHQVRVPLAGFERLNPHIDLQDSGFRLLQQAEPWPGRSSYPRLAALSSFGFSGTNAHVVVSEYAGTEQPRRRSLTPAPFNLRRYWIPAELWATLPLALPAHPLLDRLDLAASTGDGLWLEKTIRSQSPLLSGYRVQGVATLPPLAYLEMLMAAARLMVPNHHWCIQDLVWALPCRIQQQAVTLRLQLQQQATGYRFVFSSDWGTHCHGLLVAEDQPPAAAVDLTQFLPTATEPVTGAQVRDYYRRQGLELGPDFIGLERLQLGPDQLLGWLNLPPGAQPGRGVYALHPALGEAALQAASWLFAGSRPVDSELLLPQRVAQAKWLRPVPDNALVCARVTGHLTMDLALLDEQGCVCARLDAVVLSPIATQTHPVETLLSEVSAFLQAFDQLEQWAITRLWQVMAEHLPRQGFVLANWAAAQAILPKYQRLLAVLITLLQEKGYIQTQANSSTGEVGVTAKPVSEPALLQQQRQQLVASNRYLQPFARLIWDCTEALWRILTGHTETTRVLFPTGRAEDVAGIYGDNPLADAFNQALARRVRAAVQLHSRQQPLRLLEIGAGTGATTALVLAALQDQNLAQAVEYHFSDLSPAFVRQAQARFQQPFVRFQVFDLEATPPEAMAPFDIVIAVNVVHATRSIAQSLQHIKALLVPGGLLLLNEITARTAFGALTFGLTDGWWAFDAQEGRLPGCPLLDGTGWERVLQQAGFGQIQSQGQQWCAGYALDYRLLQAATPIAQPMVTPAPPSALDPEEDLSYVGQILATVLKMPADAIEPDQSLQEYGVDSLVTQQIVSALVPDFGNLPATLVFEHSTTRKLALYLRRQHGPQLDAGYQRLHRTVELFAMPLPDRPIVSPQPTPVPAPTSTTVATPLDIAIIGMAGRYPLADDLEQFWQHLYQGDDCITEVPPPRWDWHQYYDPDPEVVGKSYTARAGFIADADCFDARFFRIAPREAEDMDPQERLFLETAWHCVEQAGYDPSALGKSQAVGVFVGVMNANYNQLATEAWQPGQPLRAKTAYWSIANRVSFCLDYRGPSLAVDTACSSSLTAIHLACHSLLRGECALALAGGVNLILHPAHLVCLADLRMLSASGRCQSFGEGADGFVDGEGVGAVLLKPLAQAIADGDAILGVIKGSALNSGGHTNGYTVPNPQAQARLVAQAIASAAVDPRSITYIEAHGTGTVLGDPIEMVGLRTAFGDDQTARVIGSVKSNIGHAEAAAGIAGLSKVLLQLQQQQLAPSLYAEKLNPKLEMGDFRLLSRVETWPPPVVAGQPALRCAGLSSFGAGGANAHLIVQEAAANPRYAPALAGPFLLPFSARDEAALKRLLQRYVEFLSSGAADDPYWMQDLAFVLQQGRTPLAQRLVVLASQPAELRQALSSALQGQSCPGVLSPQTLDNSLVLKGKAGRAYLQTALQTHELETLARIWVNGTDIDWSPLWQGCEVRRRQLPLYPFARTRHWLKNHALATMPQTTTALLGPAVHTPTGWDFAVLVTPEMPLLAQHRVSGQAILPGVISLILATAAWHQVSAGEPCGLSDIQWLHPLIGHAKQPIQLRLVQDSSARSFQIQQNGRCPVQGRYREEAVKIPARPELAQLRQRLCEWRDGREIYTALQALNIAHGPFYQVIKRFAGGPQEALVELILTPDNQVSTEVWQPALLDGALQALGGITTLGGQPLLPFALGEVVLLQPPGQQAWCYAECLAEFRFNLTVYNANGDCVAWFGNLEARPFGDSLAKLFYVPQWFRMPCTAQPALVPLAPLAPWVWEWAQTPQLLRYDPQLSQWQPVDMQTERWLQAPLAEPLQCLWIAPSQDTAQAELSADGGCFALLQFIQQLSNSPWLERGVHLTLLTRQALTVLGEPVLDPLPAALHGMALVAAREFPRWIIDCVDVDNNSLNLALPLLPVTQAVMAIRSGQAYCRRLEPVQLPVSETPYRQQGVYVLIGGAGGIGLALAEDLVTRFQAKLILIGRSPLDETRQRAIAAMGAGNQGEIHYWQADATDEQAMQQIWRRAETTVGPINGVVHCALVLADRALRQMDEATLQAALAPKMRAARVLERCLQGKSLDFLAFFSSAQSFLGNAGQANYAAGCTFIDAWAQYLAHRCPYPVRVLNWGFWGETGSVATPEYTRLLRAKGILPITTQQGLAATERALAAPLLQTVPFRAEPEFLHQAGISTGVGLVARAPAYPRIIPKLSNELTTVDLEALQRIQQGMLWLDQAAAALFWPCSARPPQSFDLTAFAQDYPELSAYSRLLQACASAYNDFLHDRRQPAEILFPQGSTALVAGIYQGHALADGLNHKLAEAVRQFIQQCPAARIRILEIGGGTGATTRALLPALLPFANRIRYEFSDLSPAFVKQARAAWAETYPFMRFEVRDIRQVPSVAVGYDLVIASNVLHATPDLRVALDHIRMLLRPHGLLALNELTAHSPFATFTFGLLDDWWAYQDHLRLPGGPLLDCNRWGQLLAEQGFSHISTHGFDGLGQHLILASCGVLAPKLKPDLLPAPAAVPTPVLTPVLAAATPLQTQSIEQIIITAMADTLEIDPSELTVDTPHSEFGLDSILGVEVIARINRVGHWDLAVTDVFNYPTIAALAQYIVESRGLPPVSQPASPPPQPQDTPPAEQSEIAVIGMACRFPGAADLEAFWEMLSNGQEAIRPIPAERWALADWYDPDPRKPGKTYSQWGGCIEDYDHFDPAFFNISPREAELMDPQQRQFLMVAWHSLQQAGYTPQELAGKRCGIIVGAGAGDYRAKLAEQGCSADANAYAFMGNSDAILAARLAYFLDLRGPSLTIDTACSSSLVAVHLARESLCRGETDMVIAGGVTIQTTAQFQVMSAKAGMLSPTGHCYAFDDRADGFVPGEGVGVVVLKRLADALADGDQIDAVIAGSAINQDGRTNGITAPSAPSQTELETEVYRRFQIDPEQIGYIEAHGTGTKLGDPIEVEALTAAFRQFTSRRDYCGLGSVKSNIGHALAAAGVAGLIKAILCLQRQTWVPSLHYQRLNPHIRLADSPFRICQHTEHWPAPSGGTRHAAVSSFGFSGTNAHLVLREPLSAEAQRPPKRTPLPLYPFNTKPYRVAAAEVAVSSASTAMAPGEVAPQFKRERLQHQLTQDILATLAELLKVEPEAVDLDEDLTRYGLDSIGFTELMARLNERWALNLAPSLFFEHRNLHSFLDYLLDEQQPHWCQHYPETAIPTDGAPTAPISRAAASSSPVSSSEPIAIIGMAGRMPGCDDLDDFWQKLLAVESMVTEIPPERWDWRAIFGDPSKQRNRCNVRYGAFMAGVDQFDPLFFGISPREAEAMDPQQRLFLETVWHTIEEAGYRASALAGRKIGVFAGVANFDYNELWRQRTGEINAHAATGTAHSIVPNRVSFLLDFKGPSEPVDTACSSGLVAVHHALSAIREGHCEMAIAGAVNVMLTPTLHIAFNQAGMLDPSGQCRAFDQEAAGYVRGEGVGALLLKPLARAQADGDHIHGVILGGSLYHGGHANSLTAPNPATQAELLQDAYQRAGVTVDRVSYIEAHGTGTRLGDPAELSGLVKAFAALRQQQGVECVPHSCAVGSVKTNIGHLETAAGMAGLFKILLAMRYGQLPGNAHLQRLNPYIDLQNSPFHILQASQPWQPRDKNGQPIPKIAGISSFGFGGAYAHLVLQQAPARAASATPQTAALFLLTARTPEQLQALAHRWQVFATQRSGFDGLADAAYTSRNGRERFACRLSCLCREWSTLAQALAAYLAGQTHPALDTVPPDVLPEPAETAMGTLRRVPIPLYPFARESYWPPCTAQPDALSGLHPLVGRNTATLSRQQYTTVFTADFPLLREHQVAGQGILPATAYLEWAREAGCLALEQPVSALEHITWLRPIRLGPEALTVHLRLEPNAGGIQFVMSSGPETAPVIYAQGNLVNGEAATLATTTPGVSYAVLAQRCSTQWDQARCYAFFSGLGLQYGPVFQVLQQVAFNAEEALGQVQLASVDPAYQWHPAVLDAMLQTGALLMADRPQPVLMLPAALARFSVLAALPSSGFTHARLLGEPNAQGAVLTVDYYDPAGHLVARMDGLEVRALTTAPAHELLAFQRIWQTQVAPPKTLPATALTVFLYDETDLLSPALAADDDCLRIAQSAELVLEPAQLALDPTQHPHWQQLGTLLVARKPARLVLGFATTATPLWQLQVATAVVHGLGPTLARSQTPLIFVYSVGAGPVAGLDGFARSAMQEYNGLSVRFISVEADPAQHAEALRREWANTNGHVRLGSVRQVAGLQMLELAEPVALDLADKVWLLTGASGALGKLLATELARRGCRLALTGRRPPDVQLQALLSELGARAFYQAADLTAPGAIGQLIAKVQQQFGKLHGVVHAAGVTADALIAHKTPAQLIQVLNTKLEVAWQLDAALADRAELQWFILFGSLAGVTGNAGQADYAFANASLAHFVVWREALRAKGQRQGRSVCLEWPYWRDGGMRLDERVLGWMAQQFGMQPLPNPLGLELFFRALNWDSGAYSFAWGERLRLRKLLGLAPIQPAVVSAPALSEQALARRVEDYLLAMAADILKIDQAQFDPEDQMDAYGFDSINLTAFAQQINEQFEIALLPATFFEYPTLRDFAHYLARDYPGQLQAVLCPSLEVPVPPSVQQAVVEAVPVEPQPALQSQPHWRKQWRIGGASTEPIAVVGMSAMMPGADDLNTFWQRLQAGDDLVSEIPLSRWDWRDWYGDPAEGKTWVKRGGFMQRVDRFDAAFFGISPKEAALMDPQHRLFLQAVWHALEDAGHKPADLQGCKVGLFVGVSSFDYQDILRSAPDGVQAHELTGNAHSMLANRISYWFNWRGPSEPVDTACSSSLVAVHRAVCALRAGECEAAVAGGVNVLLSPLVQLAFAKAGMLSPDGRCKTFDQAADGYVRGEGVGALLLKPLTQARRDGNPIYGLIRGSAVNHGGRANHLVAPNPNAQAEVIVAAVEDARVDPRSLGYIEVHGTGTALGDPIEINGLKMAFERLCPSASMQAIPPYCGLGSVKTQIGHLEAAAGVAGLVKLMLCLRQGQLQGNIQLKQPNPQIRLENSPFYLLQHSQPWQRLTVAGQLCPRRAGISSFGFGGVNAHLIVEEAPAPISFPINPPGIQRPWLLPFSAKTDAQLRVLVEQFLAWATWPELASMAYTLQVGREAMSWRMAVVARVPEELRLRLQDYCQGNPHPEVFVAAASDSPLVASLFEEVEGETFLASLLVTGKLHKLARFWVAGAKVDWQLAYQQGTPARAHLPGYPFAATSFWAVEQAAWNRPLVPAEPARTEPTVIEFLRHCLARVAGFDPATLDAAADLNALGLDSILSMELLREIETAYGLRLFPNELMQHPTLAALAAYIEQERAALPTANKTANKPASARPLVFLLSTPRAGSTLLRVMLMGHSQLFAPPELHLLPFADMAQRQQLLLQQDKTFLAEGLLQTLCALDPLTPDAAKALVEAWCREGKTVAEVYAYLQSRLNGRRLIDKSPSYAQSLTVLVSAEQLEPKPRYIQLIRHPLGMAGSFVENRFHRLLGDDQAPWPQALALWEKYNTNLQDFLSQIPAERVFTVYFEDLVTAPGAVMAALCAWLGIEFEPAMLVPYQGERLTQGLYAQSLPIGDPNFHQHQAIEPEQALIPAPYWENLVWMPASSREQAARWGYYLQPEPVALAPAQAEFVATPNPAAYLLVQQVEWPGVVDVNALALAWNQVLRQHLALRHAFWQQEGVWWQQPTAMLYPIFKGIHANPEETVSALRARLRDDLRQALDLAAGRGAACGIAWHSALTATVTLVLHHLVADGVSLALLGRDLLACYRAPGHGLQAADARFAQYAQRLQQTPLLPAELRYWQQQIAVDFKLPQTGQGANVAEYEATVERMFTLEALGLASVSAQTRYRYLLAALYSVLADWSGQSRPILALRRHGRSGPLAAELQDTVGWFACDVPLALAVTPEQPALLDRLSAQLQSLPAEDASYLRWHLAGELPALHQVTGLRFNYQPQGLFAVAPELVDKTTELWTEPNLPRHYLLDWIVREEGEDQVRILIRYATTRHQQGMLVRLLEQWQRQLLQMASSSSKGFK